MHELITNAGDEPGHPSDTTDHIMDRLPSEARRRLRSLRNAFDEACGAARGNMDRYYHLKAKLDEVKVTASNRRVSRDDVARLETEQRGLRDEMDRVLAAGKPQERRKNDVACLLDRTERFIKKLPSGAKVIDLMTPGPTLRKGESLLDAIEARRRRVRELNADQERFEAVPLPSSEAKARARAQIDELAARGAPKVTTLVERRGTEFVFPQTHSHNRDGSFMSIDVQAVLAWLHRDALIAAVEAEIDAIADDENAMTDRQRAEKLAEIAADLLATEHEEARLIEAAAAEGVIISPRKDIAPAAVLGVKIVDQEDGENEE